MKCVLEYDLPAELEEYKLAFEGHKYAICWDELSNWLRTQYKYEDKEDVNIEKLRAKMAQIKNDVFSE